MLQRQFSRPALRIGARLTTAFLAALVVWSLPRSSEAKENLLCMNSYKQGKLLQKAVRLHQAKEAMLRCTRINCSPALRKECMFILEKLEQDAPTVVLDVTDDRGNPVTNVRVTMDGRPLVSRIDGRALPVDPGFHEFVFENAGVIFAKEKAVILQGQRNRAISANLVWRRKPGEEPVQQAAAALPPPSRRRVVDAPPSPVQAAPPVQAPSPVQAAPPAQVARVAPPPPIAPPPPAPPPPPRATPSLAKAAVKVGTPRPSSPPPADRAVPAAAEQSPPSAPRSIRARRPARAAPAPAFESSLSAEPDEENPLTNTRYLLAGVGLAGLGGAALLTYWGRKDNQLLSSCSPNCSKKSVDHIKGLYLASNIAAGVGAVALAAWAYDMMFSAPARSPESDSEPELAARGLGYHLQFQPLPSGGFAGFSGSF
jgi:hypothetical protein